MENLEQLITELGLQNKITLSEIPDIDLYMDQVTQLFEKKYNTSKRHEEDKVLTKTMINNYAKGKLLFPIKNKKYSKEHIILISLIYQLKGALSINDTKMVLEPLNSKVEKEEVDLETLYTSLLSLHDKSVSTFEENMESISADIETEMDKLDDTESGYLEKILFISSLVNTSNMYRRLSEKLVDEMKPKEKVEK
ncbi:DUF1836 domain-containing protein [Aquibacillus halophilus]|uniref:DUF1836 domain-containing protein n=1 Tax=Aquibacillus halophilus TaxID=930132 RepID=A0A6A8DT15_9BACI|nr:DUF1836 domain-containing protein [Aquibacillus halophilus]MRH44352.1 DUF1836 domain-containing protein [Aquibacillus halophilus]